MSSRTARSTRRRPRHSSGHPNEIINGSGIPANHFGLVKQTDVGVELGLQVLYRQGPAVTTTDDYSDGVLIFAVASGAAIDR